MTRYKRTRHSPELIAGFKNAPVAIVEVWDTDGDSGTLAAFAIAERTSPGERGFVYECALPQAAAPEPDTDSAERRKGAESPRVKEEG